MSSATAGFLARAREGDPVYITDVRRVFSSLPDDQSFVLSAALETVDGGLRVFDLRLPALSEQDSGEEKFVEEFFLAEMYNILSSLGGRSLVLHNPANRPEAVRLADAFKREFGPGLPRADRKGYGRSVNVIERMLSALDPSGHSVRFAFSISNRPAPKESAETTRPGALADVCRRATRNLEGKTILGVDVGGTDIKLALALDGRIACFKEYDWFPASFTHIAELIDPMLALVRLMSFAAAARRDGDGELAALLEPAMHKDADIDRINETVAAAERLRPVAPQAAFDGIGMCFPDVVTRDKVVGGEVYKTRGIRVNPAIDYEKEFARLTDLDVLLGGFLKPGGRVGIVNDGPMAAFTAAVEMASAAPEKIRDGIYAQTLGTELGTGWITAAGTIPDIPLEIYNFIADLGSYPERAYDPDDLRSLNNFNTRLPGTLQKFASQSGVFRLAMKFLPERAPEIFREIREKDFAVERDGGWRVPTAPRDMRKPFLEFMMELAQRGGNPVVDDFFKEIGAGLAVAFEEAEWILRPGVCEVVLFGRMVKKPRCFQLMREGARRVAPDLVLSAADDGLAETPLMRELRNSREYTVAQFAQAVGAVHYANYRLAKD